MVNKQVYKLDGFSNILSGLNYKSYDKHANTEFQHEILIDDETLRALTTNEGIGKKTVNLLAGDMTREWFTISQDTDGEILNYLDKLNVKKHTKTADKWALGLGGAGMVAGINDGGELNQPVKENSIKSIDWLKVFDKTDLIPKENSTYTTVDAKYGKPELYTLSTSGLSSTIDIHESRIMLFDGEEVTERQRYDNQGWGYSIFQSMFKDLRDLVVSWEYVPRIMQDAIKKVFKMKNLMQMAMTGQEDQIRNRLRVMDLTSDIMNRETIDKELEDLQYLVANITGITDMVTKMELRYSGVSSIPLTFLLGQTPQGLNATGKGEERVYYDYIAGLQDDKNTPPLSKLIRYVQLAQDGPTKGKEIEGWSIEYNSLWQQTEQEAAETRKTQAETDKIYIETGVLMPEEVEKSRFGGDAYSSETKLIEEA
jgi:phage-related protein (TIGR01555 family)